MTASRRPSAAAPVRLLPSTVTVYSTNAAPRKTSAVTAGASLAISTPRISSAPNAVFGARRRSATGMKTTAMNSSTSGQPGLAAERELRSRPRR